ncbi:AraC-type DNA-binding protein [Pedobacter westerhofensis]|uniref:AraC-type DNA-binding protein n=1 Tax=Pedobacter westerhofensis TaxID=425512 RepID=A0A521FKX4_9SPHI|nr:AraC family transcriptional regulator [Pedobacter westerhofensis]SMO96853.1 AraC-type DNA-binding protein [Pedobacter westerhofensis]
MAEIQQNTFAEIVLACFENETFRGEIILENHSLVRIISGEMKVVQSDSSYIFGAGDTLLFPRHQLSTLVKYPKDGRPYKSIVMTLTTSRLKEFYTRNQMSGGMAHSHKIVSLESNILLESLFAALTPYLDMKTELPEKIATLKVEEAIAVLHTINKDIDSILSDFSEPGKIDLAEFMEKNYMFNMTIDKFGYLTGRSLTTFKRDFKKVFKTTPQKWLTQKRLELAHYQLAEKNRKPVEVYYETGFENLSHFTFAFRKYFGYTPNEVRGNRRLNFHPEV